MNPDFDITSLIWPLVTLLLVLVVIRQVTEDIRPIVVNIVNGVATQAQSNAGAYGLAIGFGLSASLQALSDQAVILHWPLIAAACKVVNPFIVACLAYATQNKFKGGSPSNVTDIVIPKPAGVTAPPFPVPGAAAVQTQPPA